MNYAHIPYIRCLSKPDVVTAVTAAATHTGASGPCTTSLRQPLEEFILLDAEETASQKKHSEEHLHPRATTYLDQLKQEVQLPVSFPHMSPSARRESDDSKGRCRTSL